MNIWDGVDQCDLQLRQQQRQIRLNVLCVLDEQDHRANNLRALALHLCGPLFQRALHKGTHKGQRRCINMMNKRCPQELIEDALRNVLELGSIGQGLDEIRGEGPKLRARNDAADFVEGFACSVLHLQVLVIDHAAERRNDLRQASGQLLRQTARHRGQQLDAAQLRPPLLVFDAVQEGLQYLLDSRAAELRHHRAGGFLRGRADGLIRVGEGLQEKRQRRYNVWIEES